MRCDEFFYPLPHELIAQFPATQRDGSRLLVMAGSSGRLTDLNFYHLPELLQAGDLLVFNDTQVLPARLLGHKATGGKVELLLESMQDDQHMWAQVHGNKPLKPGACIHLQGGIVLALIDKKDDMFLCEVMGEMSVLQVMQQCGHVPLPPYIKRRDEALDRTRYQTVYASKPGAVAAPTAGLHFTDALLLALGNKGIDCAFVTLHIGAGTFQPVRVAHIEEHQMHSEALEVSALVCKKIRDCKVHGGRVIAVGTTVVRCLETAGQSGTLQPYRGKTNIFIYPGYVFKAVDALITNFHLPSTTLLMLVAAFAGQGNVMAAYQHAIRQRYRFFSYGDAMFITRHDDRTFL